MRHSRISSLVGLLALTGTLILSAAPRTSAAQGIHVSAPGVSAFDSFYSRTGIGFGLRIPGAANGRGVVGLLPSGQRTPDGALYFGQGSWNSALPPFGGYDPQADARFGFQVGGNSGPGFSLGLVAGQGSSRSIVGTAPSLTIPNGGSGYLFDGRWTPFVTGWTPVVGSRAHYVLPVAPRTGVHPLQWKLQQWQQNVLAQARSNSDSDADDSASHGSDTGVSQEVDAEPSGRFGDSASAAIPRPDSSSAARPAASLAQIRAARQQQVAQQKQAQADRIQELLEGAEKAAANGFPGSARTKLRQALRLADETQKAKIQTRLDQLKETP